MMHQDPNYYLKNTATGQAKLSSEWMNLRKRYYGRSARVEDQIIDNLFERAIVQNPDKAINLEEAYFMCTK